jgi:hypothetical protein
MIESLCSYASYIHAGTFPDGFKAFKDGYTLGIISVLTHKNNLSKIMVRCECIISPK